MPDDDIFELSDREWSLVLADRAARESAEAAREASARAGFDEMFDIRHGADQTPVPASTPDPRSESARRFQEVIDAGGRQEDAMAASVDVMLQAAARGDRRAIVERTAGS